VTVQDDGHFGEQVAVTYDIDEAASDPEAVVAVIDRLTALSGGGRALELAIGTGRIAVPLADRGIPVAGIEMSRAMIARLRAKPGGAEMPVVVGDMASARADGEFSLVYLVFNSVTNLTTQDAQVACFCNAARHLAPGGRFLIEVAVPPLQRLASGERLLAFAQDDTHWGIDDIDVATQSMVSHHMRRRGDAWTATSIPFRYVWPSELDLMARIAGLRLEHRWGGWLGEAFTAESRSHVSVWRKPMG